MVGVVEPMVVAMVAHVVEQVEVKVQTINQEIQNDCYMICEEHMWGVVVDVFATIDFAFGVVASAKMHCFKHWDVIYANILLLYALFCHKYSRWVFYHAIIATYSVVLHNLVAFCKHLQHQYPLGQNHFVCCYQIP